MAQWLKLDECDIVAKKDSAGYLQYTSAAIVMQAYSQQEPRGYQKYNKYPEKLLIVLYWSRHLARDQTT